MRQGVLADLSRERVRNRLGAPVAEGGPEAVDSNVVALQPAPFQLISTELLAHYRRCEAKLAVLEVAVALE